MGKIYITGDTHGNIQRFYPMHYPKLEELGTNDYLIVVGDFGFIYYEPPSNQELKELEYIGNKKFTTLFIDGNHDNHNLINSYPEISMFGGKVNKINDKLYHLKRGEIYTILDKTFFCFGGAYSIDKYRRTTNIDWWETEYPTTKEIDNAINNLNKYDNKVDYVITHTVQDHIVDYMITNRMFPMIFGDRKVNDYVCKTLEHILFNVDYTHQYFGHFHVDRKINYKHTCLFYDIISIFDEERVDIYEKDNS